MDTRRIVQKDIITIQIVSGSCGAILIATSTNLLSEIQFGYIVSEITDGDTYSPNGNSHLTITDVHLTPQRDQTRVIRRATLQGPPAGDSLTYANAPRPDAVHRDESL